MRSPPRCVQGPNFIHSQGFTGRVEKSVSVSERNPPDAIKPHWLKSGLNSRRAKLIRIERSRFAAEFTGTLFHSLYEIGRDRPVWTFLNNDVRSESPHRREFARRHAPVAWETIPGCSVRRKQEFCTENRHSCCRISGSLPNPSALQQECGNVNV